MIYKKMQTDTSNENGKIIFYQIDDANIYVNVLYHKETFWMTTKAMDYLESTHYKTPIKYIWRRGIREKNNLFQNGTSSKRRNQNSK